MAGEIIDFAKKRKESIEQKRRSFERIVLRNFLGCYSVINSNGHLYSIEMVDISRTGMLFQVPWDAQNDQQFEQGRDLDIRIYFTESSYILAMVKVKYGRKFTDDGGRSFMHYGCEFDQGNQTFEALKAFIDFIYKFAEHCSEDKGDHKLHHL